MKKKCMNKVEQEEGMVTGSSKNEKAHKNPLETCQICDEISSYFSICVNRTCINGFCSVKLAATCGPRSWLGCWVVEVSVASNKVEMQFLRYLQIQSA